MQGIENTSVPVTVLTGFLGSGKTTLLNRILTENHGKRIAVIENEFGEVGVDQELVIGADEEVFEMNNGCICCTVRGDLIRILGSLMKRKDKFDYILVETTGLADPGPVAQTFFVDDDVKAKTRLDAIVTLVDALHFSRHAGESPEVKEQIAFADVILLNKTDLVSPAELDALEAQIRAMNVTAKIIRTRDAAVDMNAILDVRGFDLDRALDVDPMFLVKEYPFEWVGTYDLATGVHEARFASGPDATMDLVAIPVADPHEPSAEEIERAALAFSTPPDARVSGDEIVPAERRVRLALDPAQPVHIRIDIKRPGGYAVFTQHGGAEYDVRLNNGTAREIEPVRAVAYKPTHSHDATVTSVGMELPGDLDEDRLNAFFRKLVAERGQDIFRMKGVLSIAKGDRRFVFQGVHMLLDGRPDRPWGDDPRVNKLVFIGRNLDRTALVEEFRACLAS